MLKGKMTSISYMLSNETRKILVIKWSALGDIVLVVPSLRAIRKFFPRAEIHLLIKKEYKGLLSSLNLVDKFIDFKKSKWRTLIPELKKEKFDLSIDFQNTWRSHLLAFFGKVKNKLGYQKKGGRFLLNIAVAEPKGVKNPIEHQAYLLSKIAINLDNFELECDVPSYTSLRFNKPYIAIAPGAGKGWDTKCWGELSFARLADGLIEKLKYSVVFLGEEREKEKIELIKKVMKEKAENLTGRTDLIQLAGIIKESSLFITHDTGPMHLAQALKVPTIALFGPTDPNRHTIPSESLFVVRRNLPCQPCYHRKCSHQKCMQLIEVEEVLKKITQILETDYTDSQHIK